PTAEARLSLITMSGDAGDDRDYRRAGVRAATKASWSVQLSRPAEAELVGRVTQSLSRRPAADAENYAG
nr:hypothetical protein [Candidatus Dormibacteraeota bacterium]